MEENYQAHQTTQTPIGFLKNITESLIIL